MSNFIRTVSIPTRRRLRSRTRERTPSDTSSKGGKMVNTRVRSGSGTPVGTGVRGKEPEGLGEMRRTETVEVV